MDARFSEWLLERMREKGWSQADLSRVSRLSRQAVANYAAGRIPQTDSIIKLARAFNVPIETVYRAAGIPLSETEDPWVEEMSHKLDQLPPNLRDVAGRMIDSMLESEEAQQARVKAKVHKNNRSAPAKK